MLLFYLVIAFYVIIVAFKMAIYVLDFIFSSFIFEEIVSCICFAESF